MARRTRTRAEATARYAALTNADRDLARAYQSFMAAGVNPKFLALLRSARKRSAGALRNADRQWGAACERERKGGR
jgi:anti-sigma factor RsiW